MTQDPRDSEKKPDSGASGEQQPEQSENKSFIVAHWCLITILILVLAVAGMYVWKNVSVNSAKAQLTESANRVITEQNRSYLRLVAVPLVWAVRSEMIRDNYDQINQYLNQFVKEQNMKVIVIAKPDGIIEVSTNKKLEGTSVTGVFPSSVLQEEKTMVSSLEGGDIMVVSPIMGISEKLGTLILLYTPPSYTLQAP
jgi:L-lactate utilization protein LutC